ncbi:MAG TPA: hypothetical protein VK907_10850, partial [Phnomibacter sp.]|nr:hypothetical protein [Phnomibacter sp.]
MSEKCFKINELTVPGSRQDERLTTGLDPGHVRADERGIEALMVFINRYAGLLNFFEWQGDGQQEYIVNGNWQPLIQSNEAFHYAGLAITPAHLPNVTFYKWSDRYEKGSDRQHRFAAWRVMWDLLFSLYRDIDGFYDALPTGMPLRNVVASEIVNHLSAGMMNATARYLNAAEPQMIPEILPKGAAPDPSKYVLFQSTAADDDVYNFGYADELITNGFNHIWIYPASGKDNWADYYDLLWNMNAETDYKAEDGFIPDFFGDDGLLGFDRIDYATLHIRRLFENAFGAYTRIIKAAADHLQQSLTNKHDHQAHHALLLAFLKIFGRLQDQLNEFTRKHLEFYYDKVLQMKPAAAAADAVHVWAQPAKGVDHYLLKKGTRLQAGKDAGGKPLFYDTTDDLTLSQAVVAEMKTIYLEPVPGSNLVQKVFASPVARSADGKGLEPIPDTWKVFGDERKDPLTNLSVNSASVGFCISAPVLHLTQGKRIIELTFSTNADGHAKTEGWTDEGLHELLYISFSTAQGWAALELTAATFTFSRPEANKFCFTITLPVDFPAVTGYDAAATADGLPSTFPSIRVLLQQDNGLEYESFKDIFLNEIGIKVTVSDMLSIAVQGGQGVLDPSSPFQPFGPVPGVGAAFYVGHPEIGYKKITEVTLKLQWEDYIDDLKAYYNYIKAGTTDNYISIASNNSFKVGWALLRNKTWIPLDTSRDLFSSASTTYCKTVLNIPDASL